MFNTVQLSEAVFPVKALRSPIDIDLDQITVYVCISNLRPLGVLNGDWACYFIRFVPPLNLTGKSGSSFTNRLFDVAASPRRCP